MDTPRDYFGRELKVGQRVLHVARRSSYMEFDLRVVDRIQDGRVFIGRPYSLSALARASVHERLVIHPEDV